MTLKKIWIDMLRIKESISGCFKMVIPTLVSCKNLLLDELVWNFIFWSLLCDGSDNNM